MSRINLKFGSTISLEEPKVGKLGLYYERPLNRSDKDDSIVIEWVKDNSPMDETKSEYYQKFLDAKICKISLNQLSSIMMGMGYSTDRSFQPPRWKL